MGVRGGFGLFETIAALGWPLMGLGVVLAAAAMRRRSKRANGLERQQLKWVTFGAAIAGVMMVANVTSWFVADDDADLNLFRIVALGIGFAAIPVAAGVAILRYRLYDIDVVINRALVYGSLTATLAGVYVGSVLLLQLALSDSPRARGWRSPPPRWRSPRCSGPARGAHPEDRGPPLLPQPLRRRAHHRGVRRPAARRGRPRRAERRSPGGRRRDDAARPRVALAADAGSVPHERDRTSSGSLGAWPRWRWP